MAAIKISIITLFTVFIFLFCYWIIGGKFERGPGVAGVYIWTVFFGLAAFAGSVAEYWKK